MTLSSNSAQGNLEYIFDEKRKIIANARSLTPLQQQLYQRNYFKRMRPDLTDKEFIGFKTKLRLGESYLNILRQKLNAEIQRSALYSSAYQARENSLVTK
eukprot:TRINITY_DN7098_c0_g2_i4.p1 TRINITY_DN7098_c0_g2~~TRINITY_DN7098_c0_g2_i4.p1  ORF type:complete len:100 (-),score=31.47 TRINITY_DN7098_c0_g2_i4:480-779(-)